MLAASVQARYSRKAGPNDASMKQALTARAVAVTAAPTPSQRGSRPEARISAAVAAKNTASGYSPTLKAASPKLSSALSVGEPGTRSRRAISDTTLTSLIKMAASPAAKAVVDNQRHRRRCGGRS